MLAQRPPPLLHPLPLNGRTTDPSFGTAGAPGRFAHTWLSTPPCPTSATTCLLYSLFNSSYTFTILLKCTLMIPLSPVAFSIVASCLYLQSLFFSLFMPSDDSLIHSYSLICPYVTFPGQKALVKFSLRDFINMYSPCLFSCHQRPLK